MANEFIFTMQDLGKVVPPNRQILKGIYLSFYFGAKIGVLGLNGSGKTSLLRIMAGEDQAFVGDARPAKGIKIGYLRQEPQLDPAKDHVPPLRSRPDQERPERLPRLVGGGA
jgi:ATPase subunit of ABC transporter with duplicated ATPase domains